MARQSTRQFSHAYELMMLLNAALLAAATGRMDEVINAVGAFVAPPECPSGCMNWATALNASEQAAGRHTRDSTPLKFWAKAACLPPTVAQSRLRGGSIRPGPGPY